MCFFLSQDTSVLIPHWTLTEKKSLIKGMILLFPVWMFQLGTNLKVWQTEWFMYRGSSLQWPENRQSSSLMRWSKAVTRSGNSEQVNKSKLSVMMKWHLDHAQVMEISSTALQSHHILFWLNQAMCWLLDQTTSDQFKFNYVNSKYLPKQISTIFQGTHNKHITVKFLPALQPQVWTIKKFTANEPLRNMRGWLCVHK